MKRQFGLAIWKHFKIVNILLIAVALVLVSENASSHPDDASLGEAALHALEEQGEITEAMHTLFDQLYENGNADKLAQYLESLAKRGEISADTHIYLQAVLRAGVPEEGSEPAAAVPATYSGNGNVTLLGQLNPRAPFTSYSDNSSTGQSYLGIWGYASAGREYALLTHSQGLSITEVTDPANPVEIQFIPSAGGRIQRDIDTYLDPVSGKTYAYFGGQEGANLYSIDLSYLPGTIPASGIVDLGRTNWTHTLQVADGLLFVNSAGSSLGCRIFDAQANPANPPLLAQSWSGSDRDCHDSFTRDNILYSADGYSTRWRIVDIAGIRGGSAPTLLGETAMKSGVYAHSNWLSDDSQYMYSFEEFNIEDINVFDVSDPANPVNVETFQWSGDATGNSPVHNGQVKGDLLHVAYYEAGYRVFDISDPANPVEVGMYETWRDPDGDGTFNKSITGIENGAWNVYTDLPSGDVLVSDTQSGLFIFQITSPPPPEPPPGAPRTLTAVGGDGQVVLTWSAPADDGGAEITDYEYRINRRNPWTSTGSTLTTHTVTELVNGTAYVFEVRAVNRIGKGRASNQGEATPKAPPSPPPTPRPFPPPPPAPRLTVPDAPTNLTAVGEDGQVVLTWEAPADDGGAEITDYEYRINGKNPWISIGSTLTTHTITGLLNGTEYTFQVRAVNRIGKGRTSSQGAPTPEEPRTVLLAHFANGNNTVFNSRVYLFNPSVKTGRVTVRVFTLPLRGGLAQELTTTPLELGSLGPKSGLNIKLVEDILTPLGITTPYTIDGGNLTLELTILAPAVRGAAQVFSSGFAFGTYPLQEIPSTSAESPTVLVANFTNGNNEALNSRVYLWNPSATDGRVTVRVFTLPNTGDSMRLQTVPLGILKAFSARNIRIAEDILAFSGIALPYTDDGGNLMLEFTIEAPDVRGVAQVFPSNMAFGTYVLQEVPSTPNVEPTVLVAHSMNGNSAIFNSRVYLFNPSTSAGEVTVRVFTLPLADGTVQELTAEPLALDTLGSRSALNIKLAEDILTPLGIATPYTTDDGNLTLEFTIQAADVKGTAQVFSSDFASGTYTLQSVPSVPTPGATQLVASFTNGNDTVFNSRISLFNPSPSAGGITVRVFTLPLGRGTAQELTTTPLELGTLEARSALDIRLAEDILVPLGVSLPYTTDGGNLVLELTIQATAVRGIAQVFSSRLSLGTYPLQ